MTIFHSDSLEIFEKLTDTFPSLIVLEGKQPIEKGWQYWCENQRPFIKNEFKNANAGIPCGPANGVIVIDVDQPDKFKAMCKERGWQVPETRTHRTGAGKPHLFYQYPQNDHRYGNRTFNDSEGKTVFDIKGIGGQVVAPGSIHPDTGKAYIVEKDVPIAAAPQWLLDLAAVEVLKAPVKSITVDKTNTDLDSLSLSYPVKSLIRNSVPKGERSEAIASVLAALVKAGASDQNIFSIFNTHKIGAKYREKGSAKDRWLQGEINRSRNFVKCTFEKPTPDNNRILSFPDVMAGVAGKFARLYAAHLEAPEHFFHMAFLTGLGAILGDRLTLNTEIQPQPRFYTILLGESADDRKSTAIKKTVDFFKASMENFNVCWGVGSAEGLQKRLENANQLLLCLDEFKKFVGKCKIEASVLLPCVNTLFEANHYESWTKKSEICLNNAYLSILAASTIQTYERTWDSSFTDIGFNNRLFLVPGSGEKKHSFPSKIPDHQIETLRTDLQKVLQHASYNQELNLTAEAKDIFHKWYLSLERSIHSKRLDTYAMRLMSLLAVNELKAEVDSEIINKTLAICDWQFEARQLHDPIDADNATAKMEERIRRVLTKQPRTDRELKQYTHAKKAGLWFYNQAKTNLLKAKEIRWNKKNKTYELTGV